MALRFSFDFSSSVSSSVLHTYVHQGASSKYHPTQLQGARRFARDILYAKQDPEVLPHMIRASIGQTIIKIVYGIDVKDTNSKYISLPEKVVRDVNEGILLSRFLVNLLPVCKYRDVLRRSY
jgi:hypothetical protein